MVSILCDSTADLREGLHGPLTVVPLGICFGGGRLFRQIKKGQYNRGCNALFVIPDPRQSRNGK